MAKVTRTTQERFKEFHAENPHVYDYLVKLARKAKARGRMKLGICLLWERARWDFSVETTGDKQFKLANDYKPWYARLIMENEPDLFGIFETRKLNAA